MLILKAYLKKNFNSKFASENLKIRQENKQRAKLKAKRNVM